MALVDQYIAARCAASSGPPHSQNGTEQLCKVFTAVSNLHNPPDRSQQVLVPILRSSVRVTAKLAICQLPPTCICRTWIQFLPEARIRATRVPACRVCWALTRDVQFVEIRRYSEDVYIPVPCFLSVPFHSMKPIISHMCLLQRITQLADYP